MNLYKITLNALSGFIIIAIINLCFADVEDILSSQAEIKAQSNKGKESGRKLSIKSKDAIQLGRSEFIKTCAVCHGDGGKGDGLFSAQLNQKPKDLTTIKKENNGTFPFLDIYEIIDGRQVAGMHGIRDMPIWGDHYSAESWFEVSTQHAETVARGKIFELLLYLNSIQE
jgi:mono/diheme cytochrome c family protein